LEISWGGSFPKRSDWQYICRIGLSESKRGHRAVEVDTGKQTLWHLGGRCRAM
jgi:hypothetical protein